jgi:hypothetical protein
MNPLIITPVLEIGRTLIDRFFPDKEQARKAEAEFLVMAAEGELKKTIAQLEINAREAAHPSIWVSGWRPFFGWIGGLGFAYATIGWHVLAWYSSRNGWPAPPAIDTEILMIVITGMLGIGGLRTYEKRQGVAK